MVGVGVGVLGVGHRCCCGCGYCCGYCCCIDYWRCLFVFVMFVCIRDDDGLAWVELIDG